MPYTGPFVQPEDPGILQTVGGWLISPFAAAAEFVTSHSPNPMISGKWLEAGISRAQSRVDSAKQDWKDAHDEESRLFAEGRRKPDATLVAAIKVRINAKKELDAAQEALDTAQFNLLDPETKREIARSRTVRAIGEAYVASVPITDNTTPTGNTLSKATIKSYKYNLPMVKESQFSEGVTSSSYTTSQQNVLDSTSGLPKNVVDAINAGSTRITSTSTRVSNSPQRASAGKSITGTNTSTASAAWVGNARSKGVIQMSRDQFDQIIKDPKKGYDSTVYGFRFLYNPSSVGMTWGTSTEVDWSYESTGQDTANAVALGLISSTLSFSLLLNRIEDFKYLNSYGLIDQNSEPYPVSVKARSADLAEIYKKGTMYDMEYLFKTLMGPNAKYRAAMSAIDTADKGWINPQPVELHLGDGLRYKVRVTDLTINHAMFNDRMVPVLSTVNVTCTRYYDSPVSEYAQDAAMANR